jgi:branched-chain amino acid transport system substrate-binding protein
MEWRPVFKMWIATAAAASLFMASCSNVEPRTTPTTASVTTVKPRDAAGDGSLRIGVLLPTTGPGSALSPPLLKAIDIAKNEINATGGVFKQPIEIVTVDEGADITSASTALEQLFVEGRVDAVVGPASSRIALGLRDRLAANQMPTCSPLATADALSDGADNGYFFRTIPSDGLEAKAMASVIDLTGGKTTSIVFPDDAYGSSFNQSLRSDLTRQGVTVLASFPYDTSAKAYKDVSARVFTGTKPDSVAIIGSGEPGAKVLAALRSNGDAKTKIVVNDGLRGAGASPSRPDANPNWLEGVQGVAPLSRPGTAAWLNQFASAATGISDAYAAYAYDCVNLIALAAVSIATDVPSRLANAILNVSRGGATCASFKDCSAAVSEKRNIDLVGASGSLDMTDAGDVSAGLFDAFTFTADGKAVVLPVPISLR